MRRLWLHGSCLVALLLAAPVLAQSPPTYLGSWGSAGTGPGQFDFPRAVAVDAAGQVYVADPGRVQVFTGDGVFVSQWPIQNPSPDALPVGIAVDGVGFVHLIIWRGNNQYHDVYTANGAFTSSGLLAGPGCECTLHFDGLAAASTGDSYLTRWGAFNVSGQPSVPVAGVVHSTYPSGGSAWGSRGSGPGQFSQPKGVAVDAAGHVYVADYGNSRVQEYTTDGAFITQWGSPGSGNGQFSNLWGIAVGAYGHVYTTQIGPSQIQEFTSDGTFVSRWGSNGSGPGQFNQPLGLAVDGAGNIFVVDTGNNRIQKFGPGSTPTVHGSWGHIKSLYR
jgi:hypothetical protein